MIIFLLVIAIAAAIAGGAVASGKNRSAAGWGVVCFLLPIALIIVLVLPSLQGTAGSHAADYNPSNNYSPGGSMANPGPGQRKCPYCAEVILSEAKICKHCQKDVPEGKETCPACGKDRWKGAYDCNCGYNFVTRSGGERPSSPSGYGF